MKIEISSDAQSCAIIHAASFTHPWTLDSFDMLLKSDGVHARLISGRAFLLTRSVVDEMEVLTLAVIPEMRRKGYAQALMKEALQDAGLKGVKTCFLEVDQKNIPAIRCYEKLGFNAISMRKNYYKTAGGLSDALMMRFQFSD